MASCLIVLTSASESLQVLGHRSKNRMEAATFDSEMSPVDRPRFGRLEVILDQEWSSQPDKYGGETISGSKRGVGVHVWYIRNLRAEILANGRARMCRTEII